MLLAIHKTLRQEIVFSGISFDIDQVLALEDYLSALYNVRFHSLIYTMLFCFNTIQYI